MLFVKYVNNKVFKFMKSPVFCLFVFGGVLFFSILYKPFSSQTPKLLCHLTIN